jgi:hypothetical protein
MKWLEIINVQTADDAEKEIQEQVDQLIDQLLTESMNDGMRKLKFYFNCSVKGNLLIHLYWETNRPEKPGSLLGLSIKQNLMRFGLINHSVCEEYGNLKTTTNIKRRVK